LTVTVPARLHSAVRATSGDRSLIVGAAGFVGSHLVARRLARGDAVHVIVRPSTDLSRLVSYRDKITVHVVTLTDRGALDAAILAARPDFVFNVAATDRREALAGFGDVQLSITDDLAGLASLIAALAVTPDPPRVMVRASSLAEYGPIPAPYVETQQEQPLTAYAAALVAGTCYARMLAHRLPYAIATARLALIYGPGQSVRFLVPTLITNCLAGRRTLLNRPSDRRDLIHVDDAVAGLEALAEKPEVGLVNLSGGKAASVLEIATHISAMTGTGADLLELGVPDLAPGTPLFLGCPKLARKALGWNVLVPLHTGLAQTIDWYRRAAPLEWKAA
jgi:nucleoside-diphosphate-sugar epimerase